MESEETRSRRRRIRSLRTMSGSLSCVSAGARRGHTGLELHDLLSGYWSEGGLQSFEYMEFFVFLRKEQ